MRLRNRGHILPAPGAQPVSSPSKTVPQCPLSRELGWLPTTWASPACVPPKAPFPPCLNPPRTLFSSPLAPPEPRSLQAPAPWADSRAAEVAAASPLGTAELTGFI